jgi:hypothetical protein
MTESARLSPLCPFLSPSLHPSLLHPPTTTFSHYLRVTFLLSQFLLNQVKNGDFSVRESSIPDFVSLLAYSLRLPVIQGTGTPLMPLYTIKFRNVKSTYTAYS